MGLGALVVARLGIEPLFWLGGTLLFLAGALGLALLGRVRFAPLTFGASRPYS